MLVEQLASAEQALSEPESVANSPLQTVLFVEDVMGTGVSETCCKQHV
jgi:hypothetical protein